MKLVDILKEIKVQKPGLIPEEKWYDEFSNCESEDIYEIKYEDFDSGEVVINKITDIDVDQNDENDWWLNCSILGKENQGEDWNEDDHPQIFVDNIEKVIKIK